MASTEDTAEIRAEEQQINNDAPQEGGGVDDEVCAGNRARMRSNDAGREKKRD